jgi:hypothetical protein
MNEVYFHNKDQCVRFDINADVVDGAAIAIGELWHGLADVGFADGIDAAVNYGNGKAYFFKGNSYVQVDIATTQVDSAAAFIVDNWSGMGDAGFDEGIQAAVNYGDGRVYFFKADKYVPYSIGEEAVEGGVGSIIDWALPQGFESDLDAVINYGNGKLYFFKGSQYARFDTATVRGEYSAAVVDYWTGMGPAGFGAGLSGSWCTAEPRVAPAPRFGPPPPPLDPVIWEQIDKDQRLRYAMERLIDNYGYPVNGAAGLVGNLFAESGLIPSRIQTSPEALPLRADNFQGELTDFSAEDVMNRNEKTQSGPAPVGIGLAQWSEAERRKKLFTYEFDGTVLGAKVLFDMDAQLDYVVDELLHRQGFGGVEKLLRKASATRSDASDEVLCNFERPAAVLEGNEPLPRSDPRVQKACKERRPLAERAFAAYQKGR